MEKWIVPMLGVAFLVLQFVFQMVYHLTTKKSNTEVISFLDKMSSRHRQEFREIVDQMQSQTVELIKEIRDDRIGNGTIKDTALATQHDVAQQGKLLHETSNNMLKVSITQKNTARIIERVEKKIDEHAVDCEKRHINLLNDIT